MKALSIRQPWAWLITHGHKDVENRTWRTSYRGPLLIHAAKTFDGAGWSWCQTTFPEILMPLPETYAKGAIVGTADLVGIESDLQNPWFQGPWGWLLTRAKPLSCPVPYRGMPGLFDVNCVEGDLWQGVL